MPPPCKPTTKSNYRSPSKHSSRKANYYRNKYGIGCIELHDGVEEAFKAAGLDG